MPSFNPFSRQKIAEAAKEIADHLRLVENVKELQDQQKQLADALKALGDRIRTIETELRALKAETLLEAVKQTQSIVNGVQGGLNQRIQDVAVQVAILRHQPVRDIGPQPSSDSQQLPGPRT
jgi:hypothetical protein